MRAAAARRSSVDQAAVTRASAGRPRPGRFGVTATGSTKFTDAGATGGPIRLAGEDRLSVSPGSVARPSGAAPGSRRPRSMLTWPLTVPLAMLTPTRPRRAVALTPVAARSIDAENVGAPGVAGTINNWSAMVPTWSGAPVMVLPA